VAIGIGDIQIPGAIGGQAFGLVETGDLPDLPRAAKNIDGSSEIVRYESVMPATVRIDRADDNGLRARGQLRTAARATAYDGEARDR
jgi:hypothetical protein